MNPKPATEYQTRECVMVKRCDEEAVQPQLEIEADLFLEPESQSDYFQNQEQFIILDSLTTGENREAPTDLGYKRGPHTPPGSPPDLPGFSDVDSDIGEGDTLAIDVDPMEQAPWDVGTRDDSDPYAPTYSQLVAAVKSEGIAAHRTIPKFPGTSVHILHDGPLKNWPQHDGRCVITYKRDYAVRHWVRELRAGNIRLRAANIVWVLADLRSRVTEGQIKTAVSALVRAVRDIKKDSRIYICDSLPIRAQPVLGIRATVFNKLMEQAMRSFWISHSQEKVFGIEIGRYFEDYPLSNHFKPEQLMDDSGVLTYLGCLHRG